MSEPFTVDHFQEYARTLILDSGDHWEPEPFQLEFLADVFAGHREIWLICPEGQGKTTLLAGLVCYVLEFKPNSVIPIAASTRDQALLLYEQAEGFILRSGLSDKLRPLFGSREIRRKDKSETGKIKVYAADDRTADGALFTLAVTDELHRHKDLRLYRTWTGKAKKRDGQVIAISTAGEIGSEFEDVRLKLREKASSRTVDGFHVRSESGGVVLHDWAVPQDADVEDMATVKRANPLSTITLDVLTQGFKSPTMDLGHWKRFTCNQAQRLEGDGISPENWDRLEDADLEFVPGTWCVGGIDYAEKMDTTAFVVVAWDSNERRAVVCTKVLKPPVTPRQFVTELVALQRLYSPIGWAYDPSGLVQTIELLEAGEHPQQEGEEFSFFLHPQTKPMAVAAGYLQEAISNEWLVHNGDDVLREHALNAVLVETKYGDQRFERPKVAHGAGRALFPIDGLTALLMAHKVAVDQHNVPAAIKRPMYAY